MPFNSRQLVSKGAHWNAGIMDLEFCVFRSSPRVLSKSVDCNYCNMEEVGRKERRRGEGRELRTRGLWKMQARK